MFSFFSRSPVPATPRVEPAQVEPPVEDQAVQGLLTAQQSVQAQMVMHEALVSLKDSRAFTGLQYETALPIGETLLSLFVEPIAAAEIAAAIVTGIAAGQVSFKQMPCRELSADGQKLFGQIDLATRLAARRS